MTRDEPARLLHALRTAGCDVFVEDGEFFCSPPARRIKWDDDPEEAIDLHREALRDLVQRERVTVH